MEDYQLIELAEKFLYPEDCEPLPYETESAIFECVGSLSMDKEVARERLREILETLEERKT